MILFLKLKKKKSVGKYYDVYIQEESIICPKTSYYVLKIQHEKQSYF